MAKKNLVKKPVKSADDTPRTNKAILGYFEGECADSNITNLNGLDITRPVWENVFNSDDYKKAIELGHYIGFLGHPEDPNCMDFEHACIVMTEGHIDDQGKIQGKFNLIDTPVGRIVKSFIDAGVKFGISVRGAGDIVDNSVDPETFVFRGFDLVSFPAFPESIPEFKEIAASTDLDKRAKYTAVCAAVKKNIEGLNTEEAIDIVQPYFAKQSDEYKALEDRKAQIRSSDAVEEEDVDLSEDKLRGMTDLYLEESQKNRDLVEESATLRRHLSSVESATRRKVDSINRIMSAQINDLNNQLNSLSSKYRTSSRRVSTLEKEIRAAKSANLKYKQKIDAAQSSAKKKDSIISELRSKLDETVVEASERNVRTSNLDARNRKLQARVEAAEALLQEYQDAYANLYANAVGVHLDNISVTASTSVSDLQKIISGSIVVQNNSSSIQAATEIDIEDLDDGGLVTL